MLGGKSMEENVYIYKVGSVTYPTSTYNFRPSKKYPETPFCELSNEKNDVYDAVRNLLILAKLDAYNIDCQKWNPFKNIVMPGNKVVVKPNMVSHENKSGYGLKCLITHPSVVAAVIDYIIIALNGNGQIIIGDAPVQECDFTKLIDESGYYRLVEYYKDKGVDIQLVDFRALRTTIEDGYRKQRIDHTVKSHIIDLGMQSEFSNLPKEAIEKLRITNYNPSELAKHHTMTKHEYSISEDVLNADVIIDIPKPKTHRKAGVTISLKNCIGMCTRKEYLPHHTIGDAENGGDGYPLPSKNREKYDLLLDKFNTLVPAHKRLRLLLLRTRMHFLRKKFHDYNEKRADGSWRGNNTIPKTIVDINKIISYCDTNGNMTDSIQRKMLTIADMIVIGQGEGPLSPEPKEFGSLAMGGNRVLFDEAIATIFFGVSIADIPTLSLARDVLLENELIDKENLMPFVVSNVKEWNGRYIEEIKRSDRMTVIAPEGWKEIFANE